MLSEEEMNQFIKDNEGLIYTALYKLFYNKESITKVADKNGMSFDDLMQVGRLALWEAEGKFDESRGYTFSTFAVSLIRFRILRELKSKGHLIRLPVHTDQKKIAFQMVPGDKPVNGDGDTIFSVIASEERLEEETLNHLHYQERVKEVLSILKELKPKDREVILMKAEGKGFQEIGDIHGYSRQAAHIRYNTALGKIHKKLKERNALKEVYYA